MANGLRCLDFGALGVLGIHGHPWLQNKFEASLSYMRPCLGKKEKKENDFKCPQGNPGRGYHTNLLLLLYLGFLNITTWYVRQQKL